MDFNCIPKIKRRILSPKIEFPKLYKLERVSIQKYALNDLDRNFKINQFMKDLNTLTNSPVKERDKDRDKDDIFGMTEKNQQFKRKKLPKISKLNFKTKVTIEDKAEKDKVELNKCFGTPALWLKKMKEEKNNNKVVVNDNQINSQRFKPLILSNKFNTCSGQYFVTNSKLRNNSQNSQGGNNANITNPNNINTNTKDMNNSNSMNVTNNAEIDEQIVSEINNYYLLFLEHK